MMVKSDTHADLAFVLYIVPLAACSIYGLVLWAQAGFGAILPQSAYLGVTKSPYVFLVGLTAVLLAATLDVTNEEVDKRKAGLFTVSKRLQRLALVCFVLALITAWYATGFTGDAGSVVFTFLSGRYAMVFPALLVAFSFLILPTLRVQKQQVKSLVAVLCLLAVPGVIYVVGKRYFGESLAVSLILIIVALFLFFSARRSNMKTAS
jgi:hypothetical protein